MFFFQAEDGIRDIGVTGVQTCALPIWAECSTCYVMGLTSDANNVYAAMAGNGGRVVAWSADTAARRWGRSGDGNVQAVDVHAGLVYAAGHFGPSFAGATRHQLAVLSASTGALRSYTLPFTG